MVNKNHCRQLLTNDERIICEERESVFLKSACELEELGLLKLNKEDYISCEKKFNVRDNLGHIIEIRKCNGFIPIEDKEEKREETCPECGELIKFEDRKIKTRYKTKITYENIKKYIIELVESFPDYIIKNHNEGFLEVESEEEKEIYLCIPKLITAENESYLSFSYVWNNHPLYIKLGNETVSHVIDRINSIEIAEIINNKSNFKYKMKVASLNIEKDDRRECLNDKFNTFLNKIDGYDFEDWFETILVPYLQDHRKLVGKYLEKLNRDRNTIFGKIYVKIGGAGNTDIREIEKYSYISQLIYSDIKIVEAKRYQGTSEIKRNHLKTVKLQMGEDPTQPGKAIIISTTNNVQSTAWDTIFKLKNNKGEWVILIFTKSMLLELLTNVKGEKLLEILPDK
ncbi:MAG: hypothetical protein ACOCRO_05345 [Halanaerobiales bacterium]